jgi:Chaperone of endosialidase
MKYPLIVLMIAFVFPFALSAQGMQNVHSWQATDPTETTIETQLHVKPVEYGLREILQLSPVIFHWTDEYDINHSRMGFVPNDVDDVINDAVYSNDSVSNADVVPVAVAALQELYQLVKYQQNAMEQMRQENLELKARLDSLEKAVYPKKITP